MTTRLFHRVLIVAAWAIFALAIAVPDIALVTHVYHQGAALDEPAFTSRQLVLLLWSTLLAAAGAVLCLILSAPAVYALSNLGSLKARPVVMAMLAAGLLCPPMVYVFAWQRVIPAGVNPYFLCATLWALWAWPIPAVLIGDAWRRAGRGTFEAARLETGTLRAFLRIGLPSIRGRIAQSGFVLFVLFLNDYGVPHACSLRVYATELLAISEASHRAVETLWPAVWPLGISMCVLFAAFFANRREVSHANGTGTAIGKTGSRLAIGGIAGWFMLSWMTPMGLIGRDVGGVLRVQETLRVYGTDLMASIGVALLGGVMAAVMALGIFSPATIRWRTTSGRIAGLAARMAAVIVLVAGLMPGSVVGLALIAAYNRPVTAVLFDHWPIIVLAHVLRFGWIAMFTVMWVMGGPLNIIVEQARTDGADDAQILARIRLPMEWPALAAAAAVVAVLSLGDIAGITLVRVPDFAPIALVMVEKFHRFEDAMLMALSLCIAGVGAAGAAVVAWAISRGNRAW